MWYCKQKTETCIYDIIWNVILPTENINLRIRHYLECDIANRKHLLEYKTLFGMWYCKQININLHKLIRHYLECDIANCKQKTWTCAYDYSCNVIVQAENINLHIRHYLECDIANRKQKLVYTTLFGMWYCQQRT